MNARTLRTNGQPGPHLSDFMFLGSLAGQFEDLQQFLHMAVLTARQSFGAAEGFMVVSLDDEPCITMTSDAPQSAAFVRLAAPYWPAALAAADPILVLRTLSGDVPGRGLPTLVTLYSDNVPVGILGLFGASPTQPAEASAVGHFLGQAVTNFRLFHEARYHLARQNLMRDLGRVFSDNGSLGEKLAAFLRRIQMLKPVEACYFSLFDRDHVNLHAVATYHLQESTRRMPPALEQKVAERATPVCIPDLAGDVFNSYLGLPLLRRGAVIAVLNLCARTPAAFSRKNVEFFTAVTEHTALLLDNAWLMEETQKQVDELTFVFRFSGILRREKTLASVMEAVLEQCIQSVQADLGYLLAFEPESAALKVLATSHEGRPAPPEGMVLPLKAADLAYSEDPRQDFPALLAPACLGPLVEGMARLLLVPLCTDRGLHAVMLVGHRLSGHMEEREHRLVMILTNAAENAIGRAMADEEMQARIREEAASRAKSEFLAVMSHELRTPLTSILGFTELLAENHFGPTNDKQQEYLQQVLGSGRHLLLLINDILDLAKVESGKMTLTLEEVDLQSFLEEVQRSFAPLVHRKNLTLRTHMGPALSPVTADPVRLKQIMYNLVSNAVKFTDSGGVEVLVRAEGGCVHIEVSDTGIGIPREEQDIIFRPFSQGSRRPGRVQEGTGLGLSLSRRLAELHGGTLTVVSEVGVGSTFHVVLPQGLRP